MNIENNESMVDYQKKILNKIISINLKDSSIIWKIWIVDDFTHNQITSLVNISELRKNNVTIHININNLKENLNSANFIYYILPTENNLNKIIEHLKKELTGYIYLSFANCIDKELFKKFCENLIKIKKTKMIKNIDYYHNEFLCNIKNMINFNIDIKYENIWNNSNNYDILLKYFAQMQNIFQTNFSFIYYKNDSENFININNKFKKDYSNNSIVIFNNNLMELSNICFHNMNYLSLILEKKNKEILKENNIIKLDNFIEKNWNENIVAVVEDVNKGIKECTNNRNNIQELKTKMDLNKLNDVLDKLPELNEKNAINSLHTNIYTNITSEIGEKYIDKLNILEEELLICHEISKDSEEIIEDILNNSNINIEDKIRLLLIILEKVNLKDQGKYYTLLEDYLKPDILVKVKELHRNNKNLSTKEGFFNNIKNKSKNIIKNKLGYNKKFEIINLLNNIYKKKNLENLEYDNIDNYDNIFIINSNYLSINEYEEIYNIQNKINKRIIYIGSKLYDNSKFKEIFDLNNN